MKNLHTIPPDREPPRMIRSAPAGRSTFFTRDPSPELERAHSHQALVRLLSFLAL